jgi:hypothetical protein
MGGRVTRCKGQKRDGNPCRSPIVLDNGYCRAHQDQAAATETPREAVHWTREWLEGMAAAIGAPERLSLTGVDLSRLDLSGIDLHGRWDGESASWIGVNLQGSDLRGANLRGADLRYADLQGARLMGTNLQGARLGLANLRGAKLAHAKLDGASLVMADLQEATLYDANLQGSDLRSADLRGVDLLGVHTGGLLKVRLYRAKLDHTLLRREQLGAGIEDEQAGGYREAQDTYLMLKRNFEDLGDYEAASWSYMKERQMEKACSAPWRARGFYGKEELGDTNDHRLPGRYPCVWWFFVRHTAKWLSDWLVELVCGYGERPSRTMVTMTIVFGLFMGIYWATWAVMKMERTAEGTVFVPTRNLVDLAIFGLGAFTTMDPQGLEPRVAWVQFLTGLEALLGIGLTGLLGFVLGNRIRRS